MGACLKGKNSSEGLSLSYDLLSTVKQSHSVFHTAGNKLTQGWVAEKDLALVIFVRSVMNIYAVHSLFVW